MISILINAIKVIFLLGFLIFIHEGGHYLVSKLCKITVNEFAIGFGPTVLKWQGKETKYAIRLIPLGGFVNLEGEDKRVESKNSFSEASILKRMAIIVAGGAVNIVFGIIVYFILMTCTGTNPSLVIDTAIPEYAAEKAGIVENDKLVKINNKKLKTKMDLDEILEKSNGEELNITVLRNNEYQDILLTPSTQEYKSTGIYLKNDNSSCKIIALEKNSSAEKAGLKANDKIEKVNNVEVNSNTEIINLINKNEEVENNSEEQNNENDKLTFTVKRGDETLEIEVVPDTIYRYFLGVQLKMLENNLGNNMYFAYFKTKDFLFSIFDNLKMIFTGNVSIDQMMGPVGISEAVAETKGINDFIYLMALISLSLGITNLLPIPALDGGKLLLLIIEAIRGKKLKESTEINIQMIGFSILMLLALFVTYNDILRIM